MAGTVPVPPPSGDDPIDPLIAECLARLSRGDPDPLVHVCAQHPEHADELRRRKAGLEALGLWTSTTAARRHIGSFELLRELGRGGMGIVWLGHQAHPIRRLAAVKVVAGRASRSVLARFEAERQALAMLVHPYIAQVLEAGQTEDGQPWFAMEFVDGVPLTAWCERHDATIDERLHLFLQLCDAVQFAHQQGVLHRDLKPGNVLVCERGGRPLVKVIDFGLAKVLQESFGAGQDLTESGQILGTPEYMSPEQAMPGPAGVDTRTDVYALGTILYELCTGLLPFDFAALRQQGFLALQRVVCEQEAPAPSARVRAAASTAAARGSAGAGAGADAGAGAAATVATRPATRTSTVSQLVRRLRGDLDWVVGKALAKDRARRYGTVAELAADVQRHLRDEPVLASPPSARYVVGKFVKRHRAGVAVASLALVGLVVTLAVVLDLLAQRDESLAGFDSLQVAIDLGRLETRAAELWPARPEKLPELDAWLADARALRDREPALRAQLAALDGPAGGRGGGGGGADGARFAQPRDAYLHGQLTGILAQYDASGALTRRVHDVASRREWAATLRQRTIDDHAAAWQRAIDTIADPAQCPDYDGMRIVPQLGFVPLGRDERSKLYEFAFPQPGEKLPERADGRWVMTPDTCMVFVLIPGGDARLGIDWPDSRLPKEWRPSDVEYVVDDDREEGGSSFRVRLDAFLIAKYEVAQSQWMRASGSNPSANSPQRFSGLGIGLTHPVDSLSPRMADEFAARLGLLLPTSAQWQYASRARCDAPWWTGFDPHGWRGNENLADAAYASRNGRVEGQDLAYDDGFVLTAPVNALRANGFGLHHVLGNVREIARCPHQKYTDARPRDGDGEMAARRNESLDPERRDVLGGSHIVGWLASRSTQRMVATVDQVGTTFGVRPSCALRRD